MRTSLFTSSAAAGLALLLAQTAVQAQSGYGYPAYTPAYSYPSTQPVIIGNSYPSASPCANGRCPVPSSTYGVSYGSTPCATGNCPTSTSCRTICGPNGCQTVCPTNNVVGGAVSPCGPNGCPPRPYGGSTNVNSTTRTLPTLNLDLNSNSQWTAPSYNQPYQAPVNNYQPSFAPRSRGGFDGFGGAGVQNPYDGDRSVQLY